MATTDKTLITTAGRSMLVDLDNNKAHANGFNIYFSTGDLTGMTDDQLVNLQDIQSKDIKVKADVIKLDQGDTKIRAQAIYTGDQKGIYIKTYATYAVDDQGNELLFALYLNSEPQYLLASNDDQETTQGYGFNVGISQTDNVNFTKLSNITATLQDVQQMIDGGDIVSLDSDQKINGKKNFIGDLQYQGNEVATTFIGYLSNSDDILNLSKNGHYIINGTNPANNPWGKNIWADVYKTDYNIVIHDNVGTEFIRSNYDSTWKQTLNNLDRDSFNSQAQSLANSTADSAQNYATSYAQYNYISSLSNDDDILNLPKNGHYVIQGTNPKNNPWGKDIWADVYKTDYNIVIHDNLGAEFIRSNYDSTWKYTLNNLDSDTFNSQIQSLSNNAANLQTGINAANNTAVKDNHDGTIGINGANLNMTKLIDSNANIFDIYAPGIWKSLWGYQNTLKNFPSTNGAATIIAIGGSLVDRSAGLKIIIIDSWGNEYHTRWATDHYLPWTQVQ